MSGTTPWKYRRSGTLFSDIILKRSSHDVSTNRLANLIFDSSRPTRSAFNSLSCFFPWLVRVGLFSSHLRWMDAGASTCTLLQLWARLQRRTLESWIWARIRRRSPSSIQWVLTIAAVVGQESAVSATNCIGETRPQSLCTLRISRNLLGNLEQQIGRGVGWVWSFTSLTNYLFLIPVGHMLVAILQ